MTPVIRQNVFLFTKIVKKTIKKTVAYLNAYNKT